MSDDRLRAKFHDRPARPPDKWMGFVGGAVVLVLGIAIAVGLWHIAGSGAPLLAQAELTETEILLDRLGFPPGPVDGVIDEASRSAISDFQVTAGLEVDGAPSPALLEELRAAKAELSGN